jgi:hypothetical protein
LPATARFENREGVGSDLHAVQGRHSVRRHRPYGAAAEANTVAIEPVKPSPILHHGIPARTYAGLRAQLNTARTADEKVGLGHSGVRQNLLQQGSVHGSLWLSATSPVRSIQRALAQPCRGLSLRLDRRQDL